MGRLIALAALLYLGYIFVRTVQKILYGVRMMRQAVEQKGKVDKPWTDKNIEEAEFEELD